MNTTPERQSWMTDEVYDWFCKEDAARRRTLQRMASESKRVLVTVKAQHPLNPDGTPGKEYMMRLNEALRLKAELEAKGLEAEFVTVGGKHEGSNVTLAEAGAKYLIAHGVREEAITQFRVIFSGNDEDRIVAEKFAHGDYCQLHVVLSAGQWDRARLYYIFMGWQPEMHPVVFLEERPNHSMVCELWGGWGVPAFAKGVQAIQAATEEIARRHIEEAERAAD